jgi:hypothetical protein
MRVCTALLKSRSAYSQSRKHFTPMLEKETHADYNERTWREQCTTNEEGFVCIPAMGLKMTIDKAAQKLKERVPGKGTKTYIDYFVGGVAPSEQMFLIYVPKGKETAPLHKNEVDYIPIWANADGRRGSGKRVLRWFPIIPVWTAHVSLDVLDDSIPKDVFERYFSESGKMVGIGRFRPENGGFNGRFEVKSVKWSNGA